MRENGGDSVGATGNGNTKAATGWPEELAEAQSSIQQDFEAFGLSGYEARVLVSLLRLGSATPAQLARMSGIHRTSAYPVLDDLSAKGLAEISPGRTAVWASLGIDEVLSRLSALQEDRFRSLQDRLGQTRKALARVVLEAPAAPLPYAQIVRGAAQVRHIYERMLRSAQSEVLVFNRPPYTWAPGRTNPVVLETLERGVETRVVYQAVQIDAPEAEGFRLETTAYLEAGVQARVVDELPIKLVVVDRSSVLFAMPAPMPANASFPSNLVVEHPGFVALQARAFDQVWNEARPLEIDSLVPGSRSSKGNKAVVEKMTRSTAGRLA